MTRLLAPLLALGLLPRPAPAAEPHEDPALAAPFAAAGVQGTFVLYDPAAETLTVHDAARAQTRFSPASTFKIPNTLIGLWAGSVKSVDEVLPYEGPPQPFSAAWVKDMPLREAIVVSNVPIYQLLARRTGLPRMQEAVTRLGYGNAALGSGVDTFWLTGPLAISAIEQTRFLAGLARGTLPFPADQQAATREILRLEQGPDFALYGKTGWQNAPGAGVGWWVGWVERAGRPLVFALNIDMKGAADAPKRIEVGRACLRILKAL